MPTLTTLSLFSGASLALLVIPGPAVLYIVARGASQGRRAALASVAGVHTGTLVHVFAAIIGLSAIIVASAAAFTAIKLAGGAYLIFLGVQTLRQRNRADASTVVTPQTRSLGRVYGDGVILNILNPKTAVFFLAFVPQFVDMNAAAGATTQILVLGAVFITLGVVTDGAYALGSGWVGSRLRGSPKLTRRKDTVAGATYIGLGLITARS